VQIIVKLDRKNSNALRKIEELGGNLRSAIRKALERSAMSVQSQAKLLAPVDTGRLRASIDRRIEGRTAYVGTNLDYAPYVEYGTRYMRAQPYFEPALERKQRTIITIFNEEIDKAARRT
jgi:HK97 gp10 family phage protein